MNTILNPEKIEQLDLWAIELRPIVLSILNGTNIMSRGQLFSVCSAKSYNLVGIYFLLYFVQQI